jgi:hypothetical protein
MPAEMRNPSIAPFVLPEMIGISAFTRHVLAKPTFVRAALVGALMLGCSPTVAVAETCLEQTQRLAMEFNLSIDPPEARPGRDPVTSEDLAESGGVIEPPPARDEAVIEAPERAQNGMPTVPDIPPDAAPPQDGPDALDPSARVTLQSILTAARAEAKRGREADCFARLSKAKAYIQRQRG